MIGMSMGKRAIVGWDERDVGTGWRRMLAYMQRAGATSRIKTRVRRRERRTASQNLKRGE